MIENKPLVSIGMPVYNGENYIRQALDSLLVQDYEHFELIISDNSSTDRTEEVCQEYAVKDGRVCYYRNEENMGAAWNFKKVMDLAKGEYFMWAAHDDVWRPEFIDLCLTKLLEEPGLGLVFTKYKIESPHDRKKVKLNHNVYLSSKFRKEVFLLLDETLTHKANMLYGVWRMKTLKAVFNKANQRGLTEEHIGKGFDQAFLLLTIGMTDIYQVPASQFTKRYESMIPGSRRQLLKAGRKNLQRMICNPSGYIRGAYKSTIRYMKLINQIYCESNLILRYFVIFTKMFIYITFRHLF